jgi:hypothetical protein
MPRGKVQGKCYACRGPVFIGTGEKVKDFGVSNAQGLPVERLAHRGECAEVVRNVTQRGKID